MRRLSADEKAGIYTTVIVHLAVVIVLLLAGLGTAIRPEKSFVLDFSKLEEKERIQQEEERLREEAEARRKAQEEQQKELAAIIAAQAEQEAPPAAPAVVEVAQVIPEPEAVPATNS